MGSGNWIIDNLNSALETWNGKLAEIWTLLSTGPEEFKGGGVWSVILNINDGLKAIGYGLLVLFFVMGIVKTCGSFTEFRKPEQVLKCFIRFALAQAAVSHGMELLTTLFTVGQEMVSVIIDASGLTAFSASNLPDEIVTMIEGVSFLESYAAICLEGCVIVLACVIFSAFASAPPAISDNSLAAATVVWNYIGEIIFNLLVLVGAVKMSDRLIRELMGLG